MSDQPTHFCEKCRALVQAFLDYRKGELIEVCPVCGDEHLRLIEFVKRTVPR